MTERSRVAKRFRELGWDPVLPDPQDDRHARELKTQNLRQALQMRQILVDQARTDRPPSADLATSSKPPLLPTKRPPRMQNLSAEKDPSYQTPPTQKMSAPGLALGSKPLQRAHLNSHGDGGSGASGSGTGPITTGPKAAALTAQGLLVSVGGDTKKNPTMTDPLSRLLQGNTNTNNSNSSNNKAQQQTTADGGSSGDGTDRDDAGNPAADLIGWKRAVQAPNLPRNSISKPPQQQQQQQQQQQKQTRLPLEPPLRRSQRRVASRLIHSSGASALLKVTGVDKSTKPNKNSEIIDPIIASPTQSPPIKLTMPRVVVNSPEKESKYKKVVVAQQVGKNKRKLDVLKVGEGGGVGAIHAAEEEQEEETEEIKEKEETAAIAAAAAAATTAEEDNNLPPPTRPTPLGERTQAPHGPRSRRSVNPLPLPPLTESVPATPAGLFNITETPEAEHGALKRFKNNIKVTGTELAHDTSNRLLPGVFSPLTEQRESLHAAHAAPLVVAAEEETGLELKAATRTEEGQQQQQQQIENNTDSLNGETKMPAILEETEATPAAYNHNRYSVVLETVQGGDKAARQPLYLQRPTSARFAALLAADMVPETALDDIDIYALDEAAAAEPLPVPTTSAAAAAVGAVTTTAKKTNNQSTAAPPPHTALPTLRPFSPYAYSLPRSTGNRLRFQSSLRPDGGFGARLGGGGGGSGGIGGALGDVTPLPMMKILQQQQHPQHQQQAPYSLLPGCRTNTITSAAAAAAPPSTSNLKPFHSGSGSALQTAILLPLPTAEEPLSLKLRLPQPALAVITSADGRYMAVLLGSHADWEPCEVLVFAISLERASPTTTTNPSAVKRVGKSVEIAAEEEEAMGGEEEEAVAGMDIDGHNTDANKLDDTNPQFKLSKQSKLAKSAAKVVASISVQRSHHAAGLPITPSSLALASTPSGDPILILSGVYDLPDGPASLGRPTIHAVHCGSSGNGNGSTFTTTGAAAANVEAAAVEAVGVGTALGVESDDPFFSLGMLGPHTLLAVGDGSSGASIIEFDPHWKSYSWGRSLPPAIKSGGGGSSGSSSAAVGLDDVCSLLITPVHGLSTDDSSLLTTKNNSKKTKSKKQQQVKGGLKSLPTSSLNNFVVTGMSATGMVGSWNMSGALSSCIATGSHAEYAVRAAIPIPHISLKGNSTFAITQPPQCFVALLQSRESPIGETAVAVATLSPYGGLVLGTPVRVPVPVTAIGCLAPYFSSSLGSSSSSANDDAIAGQETVRSASKYHHNQDKIVLGCGNGTLRVWDLRTGVCSSPIDVCGGAAITSFATTATAAVAGEAVTGALSQVTPLTTEAVICTSIAGDCVILETAALLELVE